MKWRQCQRMPSMAFGWLWECWRLWPHGTCFPAEWQSLVAEMTVLVKHDNGCPNKGRGHSDGAKRIYDTYHLHRTADRYGAIGQWFAAALIDGTTDGEIYPSKSVAIAHQHHDENYYTYIQITPANITVCSAEVMLTLARKLYDKGLRMTDPDVARREPIKRVSTEDQMAFVNHGLSTGLDWSPTQN